MKKLLLTATLLAAISATAMGAPDTTRMAESEKTADITVTANYVKLLTVGLDVTEINFGDVFTNATVADVPVIASITGDSGETFKYDVTTTGVAVLTGDTTGTLVALTDETPVILNFEVGLDTSAITADVNETVTITITYDAIEGTV